MGRRKMSGLRLRNEVWHIEKQVKGYGRLCESTGSSSYAEAERYLAHRLEQIRQASIYGVRSVHTFREAATKYLNENRHLALFRHTERYLAMLDPYIGHLPLDKIHDGTLQPFVDARKRQGVKNRTVNFALARVQRILMLAARKWRDESGLTWLAAAPMLTLLPLTDARKPYPLSWAEQRLLFDELPGHLQAMALFKVNTGCREQEVCRLRWDWEVQLPEIDTSVFVIPGAVVKNREDRLVVLNAVARSVVEAQRGKHPIAVFTFRGRPVGRINNYAWQHARQRAADRYAEVFGEPAPDGFAAVRVHDLKHTFGRRLRAAGVPLETRKVLLGHRTRDITTHYSAPEIGELVEAANRVCRDDSGKTPALTLIRPRQMGRKA